MELWSERVYKACAMSKSIKQNGVCCVCGNANVTHVREHKQQKYIECFCTQCVQKRKLVRIFEYAYNKLKECE